MGARRGSPLAVGYGPEENYLGSDSYALKTMTNKISYLDDGDVCILTNNRIEFYNSKNKNKTKILDGAFIGSNTALVAPIKIGKKATVGAGSTLSRDVKDKSLALTRAKQIEIKNYKRK